ncbi:MAG: D-glycero-beta-D-manno-heptose-7-phosphate kinase [Acidibrevibacterium sp.]|uniref:D-glycero-beta-D-manno-heptose-7-phosphate kinase n=1 Tax=Acidibrevibacterium sp. TaxID=2606776 RepID=UPI003CFC1F04
MDFSGVAVLCVGDVMLDRFIEGDVERISPEAPVPVIRVRRSRVALGGAGNVAANIAALGGRAVLVGMIGEDEAGRALRSELAAHPGIVPALVVSASRPTITKTRFVASRQQIVRTDEESSLPLQPEEEAALIAAITGAIADARAVVLSDYGKGVLSPAVLAGAIKGARGRGVAVFVDPKGDDFSRYRGATAITPNLKELAAAARLPVGDEAAAVAAARHVMAAAGGAAILVTRSEKGMILVEPAGAIHSVPAHAREVFDVSGAGDTVIATLALAAGAGFALPQAMRIANAAAAVAVSKVGTATVSIAELRREIDATEAEDMAPAVAPRPLAEMLALVARWKRQGLSVGFTNGCFDILHAGHVALLTAARAQCDRLIVALNDDASVRRLKGETRPVNPLAARATVIAALRPVDGVVAFAEDTPLALIREILPDILFKGGDYRVETVVGADLVMAAGGRVVICETLPGHSTTATIARLRAGGGA